MLLFLFVSQCLVKTNAPGQGDDRIDDQNSNEDIPAHLDWSHGRLHGSVKEAHEYHTSAARTPTGEICEMTFDPPSKDHVVR